MQKLIQFTKINVCIIALMFGLFSCRSSGKNNSGTKWLGKKDALNEPARLEPTVGPTATATILPNLQEKLIRGEISEFVVTLNDRTPIYTDIVYVYIQAYLDEIANAINPPTDPNFPTSSNIAIKIEYVDEKTTGAYIETWQTVTCKVQVGNPSGLTLNSHLYIGFFPIDDPGVGDCRPRGPTVLGSCWTAEACAIFQENIGRYNFESPITNTTDLTDQMKLAIITKYLSLARTIGHEMGHAFGLRHNDGDFAIKDTTDIANIPLMHSNAYPTELNDLANEWSKSMFTVLDRNTLAAFKGIAFTQADRETIKKAYSSQATPQP